MLLTKFVTVERILSKVNRELRGTDINESDLIEWIGEALGFLEVPEVQEESIAFLKVKNHEAVLPDYFQMVSQIAKYNKSEEDICKNYDKVIKEKNVKDDELPEVDLTCPDCCGEANLIDFVFGNLDMSYRPYFDMQWQYIPWTASSYHKRYFTPIRLANHTLFNSIVCKEKELYHRHCTEEYTIVGTTEKKLRFSFKEGYVALAYLRNAVDRDTGYPLVPEYIQHITAITYYIRWKIAEYLDWTGREGFTKKAETNMNLWLKYCKQAKNFSKMPKGIDQFQNLLEESHYMIPRHNRYYNYFGNLGRPESKKFNDPDNRNNYFTHDHR